MIDHLTPKDIANEGGLHWCLFCEQKITRDHPSPIIRLTTNQGNSYIFSYIHRECAIAFAAAIQNEFDKIS